MSTKIVSAYTLTLWVRQEVCFESDLLIIPAYHTLFYVVEGLCNVKIECIFGETQP